MSQNPYIAIGIFQTASMVTEIQVLQVCGRHFYYRLLSISYVREAIFCTVMPENPNVTTGIVKISHLIAEILLFTTSGFGHHIWLPTLAVVGHRRYGANLNGRG